LYLGALAMGGNGGCLDQPITKPRMKKPALTINASIWLKDDQRFTFLKKLEHTPRPGEILDVEGQLWRVVEWTDRIEGERAVI
jgi:hypothetical protein